MTLRDVIAIVGGTPVSAHADLDLPVSTIFAADLMSDVLAFAAPDAVLATALCNPQVLRAARMADCKAVVVVGGKLPTPEMAALADELGIPLARTTLSMVELCGRLYTAMNRPSAAGVQSESGRLCQA
jgi:hypothetical protein